MEKRLLGTAQGKRETVSKDATSPMFRNRSCICCLPGPLLALGITFPRVYIWKQLLSLFEIDHITQHIYLQIILVKIQLGDLNGESNLRRKWQIMFPQSIVCR